MKQMSFVFVPHCGQTFLYRNYGLLAAALRQKIRKSVALNTELGTLLKCLRTTALLSLILMNNCAS